MWWLQRIVNKIQRSYWVIAFCKFTKCSEKPNIIGKITLINPNIKIGKNVNFYPDVMLYGDGLIEIGDNVVIGNGTIIYASKSGGVKIGNNTVIAAQSYIIDTDHGIAKDQLIRKQSNTVAPVVIGDDVWIAAGCKVLKGSLIHDGAVIGAASLVKGEIPEYSVSVGCPAKVIKYRE